MSSEAYFDQCGKTITSHCVGKTIPMTSAGWKLLMEEMISVILFIAQVSVMSASKDFSFTMMRGINATRCMIENNLFNVWNLISAVWYFGVEYKFDKEVKKYLDQFYPYVCTCKAETDHFATLSKATLASISVFGACSEETQITELDN